MGNRVLILLVLWILYSNDSLIAAVYQWSIPVTCVLSNETQEPPQAFLWIPENCQKVRAVLVGQHNMSEENIVEHPVFRENMSELNIAVVSVTPAFNVVFDFNNGAGEQFEYMMKALADVSGYSELECAPIIPVGHSACASYPWNFAAWKPERTLAILSVHGDAPLTDLTGSGRSNPDWGNRNIDDVPGLMVEGEFEWWEDRVQPALDFQKKFPDAAISFFCDAGRGHFDVSDQLLVYLSLFIKKAVENRLPLHTPLNKPVEKVNDSTFTVRFYRMGLDNPGRTGDICLLASHPGDVDYKSSVQQISC